MKSKSQNRQSSHHNDTHESRALFCDECAESMRFVVNKLDENRDDKINDLLITTTHIKEILVRILLQ
jgi:hypothetical protein